MKVSVALVAALCCAAAALVLQQAPAAEGHDHLKVGYYDSKCRGVENVVKYHVHRAIKANRKNGAALVRLIFHDCFVRVRRSSSSIITSSSSSIRHFAEFNFTAALAAIYTKLTALQYSISASLLARATSACSCLYMAQRSQLTNERPSLQFCQIRVPCKSPPLHLSITTII
jgi:hypothetical protein